MSDKQLKLFDTWTEQLIDEVTQFQAASKMLFTTIGMKAVGNSRMWERLSGDGTITLAKADELRAWMKKEWKHLTAKGEDNA